MSCVATHVTFHEHLSPVLVIVGARQVIVTHTTMRALSALPDLPRTIAHSPLFVLSLYVLPLHSHSLDPWRGDAELFPSRTHNVTSHSRYVVVDPGL